MKHRRDNAAILWYSAPLVYKFYPLKFSSIQYIMVNSITRITEVPQFIILLLAS